LKFDKNIKKKITWAISRPWKLLNLAKENSAQGNCVNCHALTR